MGHCVVRSVTVLEGVSIDAFAVVVDLAGVHVQKLQDPREQAVLPAQQDQLFTRLGRSGMLRSIMPVVKVRLQGNAD